MQKGCFLISTHDQLITKTQLYQGSSSIWWIIKNIYITNNLHTEALTSKPFHTHIVLMIRKKSKSYKEKLIEISWLRAIYWRPSKILMKFELNYQICKPWEDSIFPEKKKQHILSDSNGLKLHLLKPLPAYLIFKPLMCFFWQHLNN